MESEATVFVVDDDHAVRASLQWLLESRGLPVKAFDAADPFLEALEQMPERPRGCLLLDVRLPGMSGLDLQTQLRRSGVVLPVIMISGHGDVAMAVRAMRAGAVDFLEKPCDERVLLDRIDEAITSQDRAEQIQAMHESLAERYQRLTRRERQVMRMVGEGMLNKQIAADLDLSPKTVEVHRANVMMKMHAGSLAELVRMAVALEGGRSGLS